MSLLAVIKNEIHRFRKHSILKKRIRRDFLAFQNMPSADKQRFPLRWEDIRPIYEDSSASAFDTHYFYHTAWAARVVAKINPKKHIDISGILYFSGVLSAFIPVEFYDFRPAPFKGLAGLISGRGDLSNLHFPTNSIESISCLHVNEHVGLGRYGDPIDPDGDIKAMKELMRVTAIGGNLIFVVPMGKPRIVFNAHRIYGYSQIIEIFKDFELMEFMLVPDNAMERGPLYNASKEESDKQAYGCGCFWFKKKK